MTKELFVETIGKIKSQLKCDERVSYYLGLAFPNAFSANLIPDNNNLLSQIIKILEEEMCDKEEWIKYFIWDLDFGENYRDGIATYGDGTDINLATSESLYDFLVSEQTRPQEERNGV